MSLPLFIVDAFAERPFTGNQAGVCLLDTPADEAWMQAVSAEMNLAETAFVVAFDDGVFGLRWFTPTVEIDLCGHATLASAHVLFETGRLAPRTTARFDTKSGRLTVRRTRAGLAMDFPATPPTPAVLPDGLAEAIGARPVWTGRTPFDFFVEVENEAAVRGLRPDLAALAQHAERGLIVTAQADAGALYDFISRCFFPAVGIPEDPVTGSAHCALGPFWAARLGRDEVQGFQASARGGFVRVTVRGERVDLVGSAVTVVRGTLDP